MAEINVSQKEGGWTQASQPGTYPQINSIYDFTAESLGQLKLWLEQNPPTIPITNIVGFQQFTAQSNEVATAETTTSTTYTDLATTGPTLSGIPNGKYVLLYGCAARNTTAGQNGLMSVSLNGAAASDTLATYATTTDYVSVARVSLQTLSNAGNNTIQCKYRSTNGAATAGFQNRYLIAFRYANP